MSQYIVEYTTGATELDRLQRPHEPRLLRGGLRLGTDRLYDALGIGNAYRDATGNSCFTAETHTLYEREVKVGERLRVATTLLGADAKRLHYFHEMFHAEEGHRVAAQELLALHIDMGVRRVAPFPPDRLAAIDAALQARRDQPLPPGVGRRIALPPATSL